MTSPRHQWDPVCDPPDGVVRPVPVDPTGRAGPRRGRGARQPMAYDESAGCSCRPAVDPDVPEQRILEQADAAHQRRRRHGMGGLPDARRRVLRRPARRRSHPGARCPSTAARCTRSGGSPATTCIRDILNPDEIVDVRGRPVHDGPAGHLRRDALRPRRASRPSSPLDMMAAAGLTTVAAMRDYVGRKQAWTGVQRARDAVALADDLSRSPQETRLRLMWQLDAGRRRPLVNRPLFDLRGRLLGLSRPARPGGRRRR